MQFNKRAPNVSTPMRRKWEGETVPGIGLVELLHQYKVRSITSQEHANTSCDTKAMPGSMAVCVRTTRQEHITGAVAMVLAWYWTTWEHLSQDASSPFSSTWLHKHKSSSENCVKTPSDTVELVFIFAFEFLNDSCQNLVCNASCKRNEIFRSF